MDKKRKINFYDLTPKDLELSFIEKGFERYRVKQVSNWVYGKDVLNSEKMKNLPAEVKDELANCYEFGLPRRDEVLESDDGSSKFVFTAPDGVQFESVLIPDGKKLTLCISTQAGCRMKCGFCFTGRQGLKRNLAVHEITAQYIIARRRCGNTITNVVYMGMGEPFDNTEMLKKSLEILTSPQMLFFSPRRITVSTLGIIDKIKEFWEWEVQANIAISLNSADEEIRTQLMPVNKKYPLEELLSACRLLKLPNRKRVTFEYVMLDGINDRDDDIKLLRKKLRGIKCKVNLIRFNPFPECAYSPSSDERIKEFADSLRTPGLTVMVRRSRGQDIMAACGQLGKKSL